MYCHAATSRLRSCCVRVQLPAGANTDFLYLGLAATSKALAGKEYIYEDTDVWLMDCTNGCLFADGKVCPRVVCLSVSCA